MSGGCTAKPKTNHAISPSGQCASAHSRLCVCLRPASSLWRATERRSTIVLLGLAVPPRFLLGSGYVGRRCDTRILFGHVFCSTEAAEQQTLSRRHGAQHRQVCRQSRSRCGPVVFARRGTPGGPIRDEDSAGSTWMRGGFGGEVLARSIPPERGLRQPFADGRQRFLTLGPFGARLPVHRQLRIGRCGVLRDGVACGNARPRRDKRSGVVRRLHRFNG
jgi:hypothetical protein